MKVYDDWKYAKNRLSELKTFLDGLEIQGPQKETIRGVFEFILAKQDADGSWIDVGGKWTGVQTAVILRALARLGYTQDSFWPIQIDTRKEVGGVKKALDFFRRSNVKVHPDSIPNDYIEDIWDSCQVMLAFKAYGLKREFEPIANHWENHWEKYYEKSLRDRAMEWAGPAFLAAILDVFIAYDLDYSATKDVLKRLLSLEKRDDHDLGYSGFLWKDSKAEPCWHASLVLRTICQTPESLLQKDEKAKIVERMTPVLLAERDETDIGHKYWGKKTLERDNPMYTARALQALTEALPYAKGELALEMQRAINIGNEYLHTKQKSEKGFPGFNIGTLKSTTVVLEYFSSLCAKVPTITTIDASECLSAQIKINEEVDFTLLHEVKNGLKLAWLTDIHMGVVKDRKSPFTLTLKRKKIFRNLFSPQKNYWAENFAEINFNNILGRLKSLGVNHVLLTGDITNLALTEQFREAREKLLTLQSFLGMEKEIGRLSSEFCTVLPGNHDVNSWSKEGKLKEFLEYFQETYPQGSGPYPFPMHKVIKSPSGFEIDLIGLDSTPSEPVEVIGMNAKGELSDDQKEGLNKELKSCLQRERFVLVALHHHPIIIPFIKSRLFDFFMSLDPSDAEDLITFCCTYNVKAILHGHFHTYSPWNAPVGLPNRIRGYMPIIGAPCGTTDAPGESVQFLELREIAVEKPGRTTRGLELKLHKLSESGTWNEEPAGVNIY